MNKALERAIKEHSEVTQGYPVYNYTHELHEIDKTLNLVAKFKQVMCISLEHFIDFMENGLVMELLPPDGDKLMFYPDYLYLDGNDWWVDYHDESISLAEIDDWLEEKGR